LKIAYEWQVTNLPPHLIPGTLRGTNFMKD
jgi:hypothetical protein